jgi:DNA-binding NtrC family response regulator
MPHKVLVVDDEPQVTDVIKQFLETEQYEVLSAGSAEAALKTLKSNSVDVIISDECMTGMSGTTFLGIARHQFPDTVRLLLTGHAELDTAINAINIGEIYRFFTKPCNFSELRAILKQAIQQKELVGESRRLLAAYKRQAAILKKMEKQHPGMTKLDKTRTGSIIIDDGSSDFEAFFSDLKREVRRAEGRSDKQADDKGPQEL